MAVAEVFLYRNATSSDATYSNSYNSKQNFPSATDLNWSVDDKVLIEWNTARDGSGSGYSVGSSINAAVNDTQGATIYYAIWETVDVIITYQGAQIATMSDTGTKTLLTSETFCEDDIVVSYTKPSSGGGGTKTVSISLAPADLIWVDGDGTAHVERMSSFHWPTRECLSGSLIIFTYDVLAPGEELAVSNAQLVTTINADLKICIYQVD